MRHFYADAHQGSLIGPTFNARIEGWHERLPIIKVARVDVRLKESHL